MWLSEQYSATSVSQRFNRIFITWDTIQHLRTQSWNWYAILDWDILSLSDTFHEIIARFASMAWNTASESWPLGLNDLVWLLWFLRPERKFFSHLVTVLWSTAPLSFIQQMFCCVVDMFEFIKPVSDVNYVVCWSVRFSNHTWSETMHSVSVHQLPQYY